MTEQPFQPSWENRRKIIRYSLLFCAAIISWCVFIGGDSKVHETAVVFAFMGGFGIIGSYVFGAAWQDVTSIKSLSSTKNNS